MFILILFFFNRTW